MDPEERAQEMARIAALYRPAVEEAVAEEDASARTELIVAAVIALFAMVAEDEGASAISASEWGQQLIDDIRGSLDLLEPDGSEAQLDRMSEWLATATLGAAAMALGVEGEEWDKTWVTQRDEAVRDIHVALDGTTIEMSSLFTVASTPPAEMMYPGQPVGPPEAWINCRCFLDVSRRVGSEVAPVDTDPDLTAQTADGSESDVSTLTAAGGGFDGVVLVVLPEGDLQVTYEDGDSTALHQTVAYLGTTDQLQDGEAESFLALAESLASIMEPFEARVAGEGTLGVDGDRIVLTEAAELQQLHDMAVADETMGRAYEERNSHPTWISHVTGSEAKPGDTIRFDRIGMWFGGDDHNTFEMGGMTASAELEQDLETAPVIMENHPVHGVAVPEGVESGDGRMFNVGGVTHRTLPLPLTWQRAALPDHLGEVIVGRLDTLDRDEAGLWHWTGELFSSVPETAEVVDLIGQRGLRGVSVRADSAREVIPTDEEIETAAAEDRVLPVAFDARLSGLTIVQVPAFQEAFIALGYPPITAGAEQVFTRGPGWATNPKETKRLHDYWTRPGEEGFAKIRWGTPGDFTRMARELTKYLPEHLVNRTAAEWHHDALGYWPGEKGKPGNPPKTASACQDGEMTSASDTAPALTLTASAPPDMVPFSYFQDPKFTGPTALDVQESPDGFRRAFGHIATWDTCHVGIDKRCITPPKSNTGYAHFHLGSVLTTEGKISAGSLTIGTGHADMNLAADGTRSHYDNTGTRAAVVRAGEDEFGIWVAGVVCEGITDEQVRDLTASGGISGDWRTIGGNLELVAGLAVNVPGFPVLRPALAASGADDLALVAAGVVTNGPSLDAIADAVASRIEAKVRKQERFRALEPLTASVREQRVARLLEDTPCSR